MRCELSLQPLSAIQPFPESRPLLEAVQAGSDVWDEGAKRTSKLLCIEHRTSPQNIYLSLTEKNRGIAGGVAQLCLV